MRSQSLALSQKTLRQAACGAVMTRQFEVMTTATRAKSPRRTASFFSLPARKKSVVFCQDTHPTPTYRCILRLYL